MKIKRTSLEGVKIITLDVKEDSRGNFTRSFCKDELNKEIIGFDIVQINQSLTLRKGTLRGLHFQTKPKEEIKIVQCLKGKIYDVVINIQPNSPDYRKYFSIELSEENKKMLYISKGFAHGFQTLTDNTFVQYLMSEYYSPEHASGVAWNDPLFNIKWPIKNPKMSEKDKQWTFLKTKYE